MMGAGWWCVEETERMAQMPKQAERGAELLWHELVRAVPYGQDGVTWYGAWGQT